MKKEFAVFTGGKVNLITTAMHGSSIETRVLKPTKGKGVRVVAVLIGMNRKAVVQWDDTLGKAGNHAKAARMLAAQWSDEELAPYGEQHRVAHLDGVRTINGWSFRVVHRSQLGG
jgi:hypothetical protein